MQRIKDEEEKKKQEEEEKKKNKSEQSRGKKPPQLNRMPPADALRVQPDNSIPTPSPLEAEALEDALEELAEGGVM